ncbi:MAG: hypothetical protein LBU73_05060 [Helicobacteraceae bacterium]|nr:hypothetical protein [Helicobacteraceae bacterium]
MDAITGYVIARSALSGRTSETVEAITWSSLAGKPNEFPPAPHTHAPQDINGGISEIVIADGKKLTFTNGILTGLEDA